MSTNIEWIEKCIKEDLIKYYEYEEFDSIEEIGSGFIGKVYKANWNQSKKCLALKSFSLDDAIVKEIIYEIKLHQEVDFNDMMLKFYGITRLNSDKYLLVTEYAEGGTLHDYLKENFLLLNWQDKYRLALQLSSAIECLHENGIVHNDLHSNNVFIHNGSIKLADFGLRKRIKNTSQFSFDTIPYNDPEGFDITREKMQDVNSAEKEKQIEKYNLNEKSDVYSVGVLFWELSSGIKPFADKVYDLFLAMEIVQGLRESIVEGTPDEYFNLYAKCWGGDPEKRPTIQEVVITLKSTASSLDSDNLEPVKNLSSKQQIIEQFKLNHGLSLDGYSIKPSKQAVLFEDGELNINLYEGQPLVYTFINDRNSHINLLNFNPDDLSYELNENLQSSDVCINFPVAEITYNADLVESFSNFMDDDETLCEIYGHLFARKILVGGKLFIDDFKSTDSTHTDSFKFLLNWVYNSAKYNDENPFNSLSALNFFPKIKTSDGENLNTIEKLTNWMNNLYQNNMVDIISYNHLILISELRFGTSSSVDPFHEKQPRVANFKEKLRLEEWIKNSIYGDLTRWIKDLHLFQGLIINKHFELEISKKIAVNFISIPVIQNVGSSVKPYLEMIKPMTNLDEFLVSNNMFSARCYITAFPFIKGVFTKSDNLSCGDYIHFLVKCEQYRIQSNIIDIKPSKEFKQAIEKALENMKPLTHLQNIFNEYGHFIPLKIVLGKSLKNILSSSSFSGTSKKVYLQSPTFESLEPHLDKLNILYLLTQKGNIVEKNDLSNWFHNARNDLEVIEFDKMTSLYDILEEEQRKKIDIILYTQDDFKIIMTGIVDLKDLDDNNTEHYKRINVEPSLEDEDYEVFGSIISKNNLKMEDFFVTFGLYDFNGFSATIKSLKDTNINITDCRILWMIIGKPSNLSVFSPKNRDFQVNYFRKSIVLQQNQFNYYVETPFPLFQEYTISINARVSTNYEVINIKLVRWSKDCIYFQIDESSNLNSSSYVTSDSDDQLDDDTDVEKAITDIDICILSSNSKSLKIDNEEKECYLDLIGYTLSNLSVMKDLSIKGKRRQANEKDQSKKSKHSRIDDVMDIDYSSPQSYPSPSYPVSQEYNEISSELNSFNDIATKIVLPFPPEINLEEIVSRGSQSKVRPRPPNAFLLYRSVFVKQLIIHQRRLPMRKVSYLAAESWKSEPREVKEEYRKLAKKAANLFDTARKESFTLITENPSPVSSKQPFKSEFPVDPLPEQDIHYHFNSENPSPVSSKQPFKSEFPVDPFSEQDPFNLYDGF